MFVSLIKINPSSNRLRVMQRRKQTFSCILLFLTFSFSPVLSFVLPDALNARARDQRPNIIFFLSDDQRSDFLGSAGHPVLQTPNLDKLAEDGVRFENAFVTTSICAASRASIFTGLWERTHGYTFGEPPVQKKHWDKAYPKVLREAGYRTGFIGKYGVSMEGPARKQMFDVFQHLGRSPYFKKQSDGNRRHITQLSADHAIDFIQSSSDQETPFHLSVSFNAPHAEDGDKDDHFPWPKVVDGMYEHAEIRTPKISTDYYRNLPDFLNESINRKRYFWRWDTLEKYEQNVKAYYRMISGIDHAIGRVMNELEKQGVADETVIIFAGDNGYYKGSRGYAGKWSHFDESLRVPLIVFDPRAPDNQRNRVVSPMALNVDIPATIVDYGGEPVPDLYQGRSLIPIMQGKTPDDWRDHFFAEHLMDDSRIPKWEGIRGERYVYAHYFEDDYEFLHDLKKDPKQLQNVVDDPKYQDVLSHLRERTETLREQYERTQVHAKPTVVEGVKNSALAYDGRRSFTKLGTVPPLKKNDEFTWSVWVNIQKNNPKSGVLLGNRNRPGGGPRQFMKFTHHSVQYFNGDKSLKLNHQLPREKWVHLVLVKAGEQLRYYVDGKPVATAEVDFDMPSLPLYAGGDPRANELAATAVDEVRLYEQALSEKQINQLANPENISPNPVDYWSMDEPLRNTSSD